MPPSPTAMPPLPHWPQLPSGSSEMVLSQITQALSQFTKIAERLAVPIAAAPTMLHLNPDPSGAIREFSGSDRDMSP